MKKVFFFLCVLLAGMTSKSFAQTAVATLGDIEANTSATPLLTTTDRITRNAGLIVATPGYTVTSYNCSITAGGTTWGPVSVTGSLLTPAIKSQVRATRGPNVLVTFDNIHATHSGSDVTLPKILLKYDQ